jgi:hypothetical protein
MGLVVLFFNLLSSIIISMILYQNKFIKFILCFWGIFNGQIILFTYILSMLNMISFNGYFILHLSVLIVTLFLYLIKRESLLIPRTVMISIKEFILKDKLLAVFVIIISILMLYNLVIAIAMPPINHDGLSYHLSRIIQWIQNKNVNQFFTNDWRETAFPPNSEILMMWTMLLAKSDYFVQTIQWFSAYFAAISIISLAITAKLSIRQSIFTGYIFLTLPMVALQSSTVQNDLIVTAFFLPFLYFLLQYVFNKKNICDIIISSIFLGLAMGTKYTMIFFGPVFILLLILFFVKFRRNLNKKQIIVMISIYIAGFIFLASYNYVSNYVSFGNPIASETSIESNSTVKLPFSNIIRYTFQMMDFTGAPPKVDYRLSLAQKKLEQFVYSKFKIERNSVEKSIRYENRPYWNISRPHEDFAAFGMIGFLAIIAVPILTRKNKALLLYYITGVSWMITFSIVVPWTPYKTRYFILPMALIVIGLGAVVPRHKKTNKYTYSYILLCLSAIYIFSYVSLLGRNKNIGLVTKISRQEIVNIFRLNTTDRFAYDVMKLIVKPGSKVGSAVPQSDVGGYSLYTNLNPVKFVNVPLSENVAETFEKYDVDYILIYSRDDQFYDLPKIPNSKWYLAKRDSNYNNIEAMIIDNCGELAIDKYKNLAEKYKINLGIEKER